MKTTGPGPTTPAKNPTRPVSAQNELIKAALAGSTNPKRPPQNPTVPVSGAAAPPAKKIPAKPQFLIGPDGKPVLGPDGKPRLVEAIEAVPFTLNTGSRAAEFRRSTLRNLAIGAVTCGALVAGFYTPFMQHAYDSFLVRRAAGELPMTTVSASDMGAGTVQIKLPDGSTSALDEKTHRQVYRYDHELEIANGRKARVAFDVTGYPAGIDDALLVGRRNDPQTSDGQETHGYKKFRQVRFTEPARADGVDHPGQVACHFQLVNRDENVFGLVFHFDEATTDPKAEAAVIALVLGSVQE